MTSAKKSAASKTSDKPQKAKNSTSSVSTQQPDLVKRAQALELRLRGYSFSAVGKAMVDEKGEPAPISAQRAYELVSEGLAVAQARYTEKASEVLQFEIKRIDRMIAGLEENIFIPDVVLSTLTEEQRQANMKLCLKSMDMADRLLDRKARLLGFYRSDEQGRIKQPLPWVDND